jgi:hypothetical protein
MPKIKLYIGASVQQSVVTEGMLTIDNTDVTIDNDITTIDET